MPTESLGNSRRLGSPLPPPSSKRSLLNPRDPERSRFPPPGERRPRRDAPPALRSERSPLCLAPPPPRMRAAPPRGQPFGAARSAASCTFSSPSLMGGVGWGGEGRGGRKAGGRRRARAAGSAGWFARSSGARRLRPLGSPRRLRDASALAAAVATVGRPGGLLLLPRSPATCLAASRRVPGAQGAGGGARLVVAGRLAGWPRRLPRTMPRVVPDQRSKFENEEFFRKLSRECEIKYTGFRDRPHEERQARFQNACRDGRSEIAFVATGTNLSLQFFPASWQGEQRQTPTREYVDFEREGGKVYLKAPMILNGVCVIWKGWIDLQRLDGMGCLEFDEERAQEDALAQQAFEEARRRTREFEDRDRSHREEMEARRQQDPSPGSNLGSGDDLKLR
ncbi:core-binding factor subunit beta [Crotalus adamanteus]